MHFERTREGALIRRVLTHPSIYPHITDDSAPTPEQYVPNENDDIWYVTAKDADELLGIFILVPQNCATYEIHTCLLPCAWGARAAVAALGITPWFFAQIDRCHRIVTNVPANNRLALRFARKAGMTQYGLNPLSFLKAGVLHDQHLLGLSRS